MPAGPDYKTDAIVLKWVKLKESDAILKMVSPTGALVEGVAKGIRKPKSSSSSKLEQFNCVEVLLARGKSLDVIKDSRLIQTNEGLRQDPAAVACASCLAEIYAKSLQADIEVPNAYGMAKEFFRLLGECPIEGLAALTSASMLKACAYLGFMPSFHRCVLCDEDIDTFEQSSFSFMEGGVICGNCRQKHALSRADARTISAAAALLHMRLRDIVDAHYPTSLGLECMRLSYTWLKGQTGIALKSYPLALQLCSV